MRTSSTKPKRGAFIFALLDIKSGHLLAIFILFEFFFLVFRNMGMQPVVLADEYTYSKFSRLIPYSDANIPDYLYFLIYHATNVCGPGFLECSRILNTIFFVLSAPFIYSICKKYCSKQNSLLITVISLLSPTNIYTGYFMPESLYFLSFWAFIWLLTNAVQNPNRFSWATAGCILGTSALIKPHALFLLPASILYIIYISFSTKPAQPLSVFGDSCYFTFSTFSTKAVLGWAIAGSSGVTIFGPAYSSIANNDSIFHRYISLIPSTIHNLTGHILALLLTYGVAIATAIYYFRPMRRASQLKANNDHIVFLSLLLLPSLLIVVAAFTASVSGSGPYESTNRLHMRYYDFCLPLLLIYIASRLSTAGAPNRPILKSIIGLPAASLALYATYYHLAPYTPSFVDSPDLGGFLLNPVAFTILGIGSTLGLLLWIYNDQIGIKFYLYIFIPTSIILSNIYIVDMAQNSQTPNNFDKAAIFTKQVLSKEELSRTLVVGSDESGLFRALFHMDNPSTSLKLISKQSTYNIASLPKNIEWALVIGNHPILCGSQFYKLTTQNFTLIHAQSSLKLNFRSPLSYNTVARNYGLGNPESWGTWSIGHEVRIHFLNPLPRRFELHIVARAFGPNVQSKFLVNLGNQVAQLELKEHDTEHSLTFDNSGRLNDISITIPHPESPAELGISTDPRRLGIGLVELDIMPVVNSPSGPNSDNSCPKELSFFKG